MNMIKPTYDTLAVCEILSRAAGYTITPAHVRNMSRRGCVLFRCHRRRGVYGSDGIKSAANKFIRRRLAASMGRISPRFLDRTHSRECIQCKGIAVEWGGNVKCENGHTYIEAVDPGKPGGDHTAVATFEDGKLIKEGENG